MQVLSLVPGIAVLAGGVYLAFAHKALATMFRTYYDRQPEINVGPRWLFSKRRPSDFQVNVFAWLFTLGAFALGITLIIYAIVQ